MNWTAWVRGPGLAPVWQDFTTPKLNESIAMANEYIKLAGASSPADNKDYLTWYSSLKVVFLNQLFGRVNDTSISVIELIDADLNITYTLDPEC